MGPDKPNKNAQQNCVSILGCKVWSWCKATQVINSKKAAG